MSISFVTKLQENTQRADKKVSRTYEGLLLFTQLNKHKYGVLSMPMIIA